MNNNKRFKKFFILKVDIFCINLFKVHSYRSTSGGTRRSPTVPYNAISSHIQDNSVALVVPPTNMSEHEIRHEQLLKQGIDNSLHKKLDTYVNVICLA